MRALSLLLFFVLTAIAGLHAYWAIGGLWPGATEEELIRTVIGDPGFKRMPPAWMTFTVSGLLITAAFIGLSASGVAPIGWGWLARIGATGVALVFLARGAATYRLPGVAAGLTEPFATYNIWLYSPLCIALGAGFVMVAAVGRR
ncbi:MAG: DUF3995 domain-containing protein [Pseudomonadota bacterium]